MNGKGLNGKYIPAGMVSLFFLLVYLLKEDKQSLKQIEQFTLERAIKAGWQSEEKKVA